MKRSDLKKILMQEAFSILSEKMSDFQFRQRMAAADKAAKAKEGRCEEIMAMTPQQIADNMLEDEYRECRGSMNLSDRLRNMVDNYESGEQPSEETLKSMASVGINPAAIDNKEDLASAAEKMVTAKPTGVKPGEKPTRMQPRKKTKQKDLTFDGKVIYGLTSKDNPESLLNILSKAGFEADIVRKVVAKMAQLADDDNIVLEAVSLRGRGSEQDRVMNSESVGELISLVRSLGLDANQNRAMMKALNNWGNRNTVRFEKPTFAPTATAPEAPTAPTTPPQPEKDVLDAAEDYLKDLESDLAGMKDIPAAEKEDALEAAEDYLKDLESDLASMSDLDDAKEEEILGAIEKSIQDIKSDLDTPQPQPEPEPEPEPQDAEEEPEFPFRQDLVRGVRYMSSDEPEEPRMNRDEDIKQTLKKLDRVYSVDDFKEEYLGLLFRTEDWKKLFDNEREAESAVNKAIDNIKENARDIDMALRSETMPSSEIVSSFNNIQNFGNQEAMFTSRLLELALFEYSFDKLSVIKKASDGKKNKESYSVWKDGPGKIGQIAIEALINQNYANRLAARRAAPNTPDTETLQEHKTLNRWKLLAGIK